MSLETHHLELETHFTITHGTRNVVENFVVKVRDAHGNVGIAGEAPSPQYGETPATVKVVLPELLEVIERIDDPSG